VRGVVLAAGKGTRLRPITFSIPKPLIPLLGRPLITYGIEQLKMIGIRDITVVIGWLSDMFKEVLGDGKKYGVNISYVLQERRLGIAHAIHLAIINDRINEPFIVYLGDNILTDMWTKEFKLLSENYDAILFLTEVSNPQRFGVAIVKDGKIIGFVEKPKHPPSNLALVGLYYFRDPDEYEKCFSTLKPSWRGEYEITDIINCYLKRGKNVGYIKIKGWWKDAGKPEDLIGAMILLMDTYIKESIIRGEVIGNVHGKVIVEEGARVEGEVFGPAYIAKNVYIGKHAKVEHYVDLEEGVRLDSGSLSRSIVLNSSNINAQYSRIVDSVIGPNSNIWISNDLRINLRLVVAQESVLKID